MPVTVLGMGTIGSTVAYRLASRGCSVRCADVEESKSEGHVTDIAHSIAHAGHPVGCGEPIGDIESDPAGPGVVTDADLVVVTTSAPRPPSANQRGGRTEWLEENLDIATEVSSWLRDAEPCPVLVVTNPVDTITYELYRQSSWPARRFIGYSLSETTRMAHLLAAEHDVSVAAVQCPVLGEHGEYMVPVFSRATVAGDPLTVDEDSRQSILDRVRNVPYEVMEARGAEESSRWVTGTGVALLAERILEGGTDEAVGLSTPLDGEFSFRDVALSVPVTLNTAGVAAVEEWDLSDWERSRMEAASQAVAARRPDARDPADGA